MMNRNKRKGNPYFWLGTVVSCVAWQSYSKSRPYKQYEKYNTLKTVYKLALLLLTFLFSGLDMSVFGHKRFNSTVKKIIIDAGHGGRDPGNLGTGRYRAKEKDISLDIALMAGKIISEKLPGVEIIYTRDKDKSLELIERTNIANREKADLFISIHCDAFTSSSAIGSSTFVMGRDHSDENMRVAQRENSVIFLEENYEENYEGFDPSKPETYIGLTLYQNHFQSQSITLAQYVQDEFRKNVGRKDRGVKQQPLWVTSRAAMPAILIELGFLTNSKEEDFLNSVAGKKQMAEAIYRAVEQFKNENDQLKGSNNTKDSDKNEKSNGIIENAESKPNSVQKANDAPFIKEKQPTKKVESKPLVHFRVQIKTSSKKLSLDSSSDFKSIAGKVDFYIDQTRYKYTYGEFSDYSSAQKAAIEMRRLGFDGSFVIAFKEGKRIDINEARKQSN